MTESNSHADLNSRALLYLSGELTAADLAAFEERLAADEQYQEALVAAVSVWPGLCEHHPDQRFRERAAAQLRATQRPRIVLVSKHHDRMRSFTWALVGGIAAAILVILVNPARWSNPPAGPTYLRNPPPALVPADTTTEVIYSDLSNTERLGRVRLEQEQRRQRQDDLRIHHPPLAPRGNPAERGKSML
jgi:hypothetical protein